MQNRPPFLKAHPAHTSTIAVIGTLDSKAEEHDYVSQKLREWGHEVLLVDVGTLGQPGVEPHFTRQQVAAYGGPDWQAVLARQDRGASVAFMARAAAAFVVDLHAAGRIQGILSLGGGGGTAIGTAAMRALPIGLPKVMVSTLASGQTASYVGTKDILMLPAITDVAGLNRISRLIFDQAAGAISGMVRALAQREDRAPQWEKPLVLASMFGNTTPCVNAAREILEAAGYEVLTFAATGTGGRTLESLAESGLAAGVLDITTTEWADELLGGVLSAGPHRLEAAGKAGVPAIITPGCLDMVNFAEPDSVPAAYAARQFYAHNPQVTLMRTTALECTQLGQILAEKINTYTAPVTVLLPLRGTSLLSAPGQPFHDPVADAALFHALKSVLRADIPVLEVDAAVNAPLFAKKCAEELLKNIAQHALAQKASM
jgi:uncharacterized protein (UPF0261 family)